MDIREIEAIIPHRYPFLLLDRITELVPGKRVAGLKKVTAGDVFLQSGPGGKRCLPG